MYKETRAKYYQENKEAFAKRSREWYANPDHKVRLREKKLGVDFWQLVADQDNKCGICDEEFSDYSQVHIDHDHDTGVVRGLLCKQHNRGLGFFKDDAALLLRAAAWITKGRVKDE